MVNKYKFVVYFWANNMRSSYRTVWMESHETVLELYSNRAQEILEVLVAIHGAEKVEMFRGETVQKEEWVPCLNT